MILKREEEMSVEIKPSASNIELRIEETHSVSSLITNPYITAATSNNTRKAYISDVRHFERWGGKLPASPETIAHYLQYYAPKLNSRTIARRLTAIKQWHHYQGLSDPTQHPAISKIMKGIHRLHGKPKQKAHPLGMDELVMLVKYLAQQGSLSAMRDNALIQVGFLGAFRRSELVQIEVEHLNWKAEGLEILIPGSKTDQTHQGEYCALPYGQGLLCPVTALKAWLEVSKIKNGAIFRMIKKGEKIQFKALTPLSVNLILKKNAAACGLNAIEKLSGHSFRRGMASNAGRLGANLITIMKQGRWKNTSTMIEYIEAGERFKENAALKILQAAKE